MNGLLAYCGIACAGCPVHWATVEPDPERKARLHDYIARAVTEEHGLPMEPDEVADCDGCTSHTGRRFAPCGDCKVRPCAQARELETCASCPDYPCERLEEVFKLEPSARTRLDVLRSVR